METVFHADISESLDVFNAKTYAEIEAILRIINKDPDFLIRIIENFNSDQLVAYAQGDSTPESNDIYLNQNLSLDESFADAELPDPEPFSGYSSDSPGGSNGGTNTHIDHMQRVRGISIKIHESQAEINAVAAETATAIEADTASIAVETDIPVEADASEMIGNTGGMEDGCFAFLFLWILILFRNRIPSYLWIIIASFTLFGTIFFYVGGDISTTLKLFLALWILIPFRFAMDYVYAKFKERDKRLKEAEMRDINEFDAVQRHSLEHQNDALVKAFEVLNQPNVKRYVCISLNSISSDTFEISKYITPVLISMIFMGVITIPLNSLIFASIAVIVSKTGVSTICSSIKQESGTEFLKFAEAIAEKGFSKYDLRGAQFAGGFAETVKGNQLGEFRKSVDMASKADKEKVALELVKDIQFLFQRLDSFGLDFSNFEKVAFIAAMISPDTKERIAVAKLGLNQTILRSILEADYFDNVIAVINTFG